MKLLIGKNSSIVKNIREKLIDFEFVSHKDIKKLNFKKYEYIYVFSWSRKSLDDNLKVLKNLPIEKVVFISTLAIYSINIRKQWNSYPKHKLLAEKYVAENNGKILRIGITEDHIRQFSAYDIPVTAYDDIADFLNSDCKNSFENNIKDLFKIKEAKSNRKTIAYYMYLSSLLIDWMPYRIFIESISKICGSLYYGFTADMLRLFSKEALIGYGVLGSEYYKKQAYKPAVIVSNMLNTKLVDNGFKNTIIGKGKIGLAQLWRGSKVIKKENKIYRSTPLFLKKPTLPSKALFSDIAEVTKEDNHYRITSRHNRDSFFTKKVIFSCGPFENTKLISKLISNKSKVFLSDHEIYNLGIIEGDSLFKKKFLKVFGPFVIRNNLLEIKDIKNKTLVEFKPYSEMHFLGNANKIYLDTTTNIILKLIKNFSFSRINEAIFTKFGIAFKTTKYTIFCQTLNKDCIVYNPLTTKFKRDRFAKDDFKFIASKLTKIIGRFEEKYPSETIDGQHVMGSGALLDDKLLKDQINQKNILILGSPTNLELDHIHHTSIFLDQINKENYE